MKKSLSHSAKPSYIGYVYQGFYALLLLLDSADNTQVSIETKDDIEIADPKNLTLFQLKHNMGLTPPRLTLSNEGFWKTIVIWSKYADDKQVGCLMFVTSAEISTSSPLKKIENKYCKVSDLKQLVLDIEKEAKNVIDQRLDANAKKKKKLPHEVKYKGCEAYLTMSANQREMLLAKMVIVSKAVQIQNIPDEVMKKMLLIPLKYRSTISTKLIEWWSIRVVRSLYNKSEEVIYRSELQQKVFELIQECREDSLSNEYKNRNPDDMEIYKDSNMEKQIKAVKGGSARVSRATKARWRAMNQRKVWLMSDISVVPKIDEFDRGLKEEWKDKFDIMTEDCKKTDEDEKCNRGLALLDWTHDEAPKVVPPIVEKWNDDFLVRGSYQELADKGEVGWHPDYESVIEKL